MVIDYYCLTDPRRRDILAVHNAWSIACRYIKPEFSGDGELLVSLAFLPSNLFLAWRRAR